MFPETKCDHCPLKGEDLQCIAQINMVESRLCYHARSGHEGYIRIIKGESVVHKESTTFVSEIIPHEEQSGFYTKPDPSGKFVKVSRDKIALRNEIYKFRSCKHMESCGCGQKYLGKCKLGHGENGGEGVYLDNCRECPDFSKRS